MLYSNLGGLINILILYLCRTMASLRASRATCAFLSGDRERKAAVSLSFGSEEILGSCNEVLMARCAVTFLIPQCYRATNTPPLFFLGL